MKSLKLLLYLSSFYCFACQSNSQKSENQVDNSDSESEKIDTIPLTGRSEKIDTFPIIPKFEKAKLNEKAQQLALSNNRFGFDFYKILAKSTSNSQNICFSPLSLHSALGMLYEGTSGKTQAEIKKSLYLPDSKDLALDYYNLLGHLYAQNNENTRINIANSIWVQKNFFLYKIK